MESFLFSKWRIAFGCLAGRKRVCSSRSFSLSPLTEYQAREEKEDEEVEILAVLLFSSPSLPCSILPGSAGRQMTRVCGRLITPGWVFSNLFNGSLLKTKMKEKKRRKEDEHRRKAGLSPQWPGESTQPRKNQRRRRRRRRRGCTDSPGRDTREDQTTPEEEEEEEERKKRGEKTQET